MPLLYSLSWARFVDVDGQNPEILNANNLRLSLSYCIKCCFTLGFTEKTAKKSQLVKEIWVLALRKYDEK